MATSATKTPYPPLTRDLTTTAPTDVEYDTVIVGGGMGGLATAAKLVSQGAKVVVLEKWVAHASLGRAPLCSCAHAWRCACRPPVMMHARVHHVAAAWATDADAG